MAKRREKQKSHNHVVPVHYLGGFSDGDRIVQVRLADLESRTISRRDAAVRSNFYNVKLDGESSNLFENSLQDIESAAAEPLRRLAHGDLGSCLEDRQAVATWCAVQYLRGPDMRQAQSDLMDMVMKADVLGRGPEGTRAALEREFGRAPTEAEVSEAWALMSDVAGYRLEARPEHHLQWMAESLSPCRLSFLHRPWTVLRFQRRRLGTSDAPVLLVPYPDQPMGPVAGFANARHVLVPLARDALLAMGELRGDDAKHEEIRVVQGTTQWERTVNSLVAGTARSAVFHHPDDDPFRGIALPEPRDREVSGGQELLELVTAMRKNMDSFDR